MALSNAALAELAGHFGIATDFWDWKGRYTEIGDQAVIAILAALGVDAATPEQAWAALEQVRLRPWRRELPPCVVIEQGQQRTIEVHVPAGDPALVHVRCEDGSVHQAQQVDNHVPDREVDGSWVGEASFALPTNLPLGYHELVLRSNDRVLTQRGLAEALRPGVERHSVELNQKQVPQVAPMRDGRGYEGGKFYLVPVGEDSANASLGMEGSGAGAREG